MKKMTGVLVLVLLVLPVQKIYSAPPVAREQYKQAISLLLGNNTSTSDQDEALRLLRAAADQSYFPAETGLGTVYENGSLIAKDIPQAIRWYTRAAEQGDWIAQLSLGRLYFVGDGISRDTTMAKKWLQQAAASGDSGSAFYLGLLNDAGQGTITNYAEAARWYKQAAEAGNPFAQQALASLLLRGQGVQRDAQQAYVWLLVAYEFGNHEVNPQLKSMEADLGKTGADAARQQAVTLHDQIAQIRAGNECNGWPGQYSQSPTPPPLLLQSACEKVR